MKKFVIGFLLATFSICVFLASLPVRADSAVPKDEEMEPYAFSNVLNVPRIKKQSSNFCWAACGASVCQYYKKANATQGIFAEKIGITTDKDASLLEMIPAFNQYGLYPQFLDEALPFGRVQSLIRYEEEPVLINTYHHAMVLDGYSTDGSNMIRCMDPDYGKYCHLSYYQLADPNGNRYPDPNRPNIYMHWEATLTNF